MGKNLINTIIHTKTTETTMREIHIHHDAYTSMCFLSLSASLESALWFFSAKVSVSSSTWGAWFACACVRASARLCESADGWLRARACVGPRDDMREWAGGY